jgi:hypothetical protein
MQWISHKGGMDPQVPLFPHHSAINHSPTTHSLISPYAYGQSIRSIRPSLC